MEMIDGDSCMVWPRWPQLGSVAASMTKERISVGVMPGTVVHCPGLKHQLNDYVTESGGRLNPWEQWSTRIPLRYKLTYGKAFVGFK